LSSAHGVVGRYMKPTTVKHGRNCSALCPSAGKGTHTFYKQLTMGVFVGLAWGLWAVAAGLKVGRFAARLWTATSPAGCHWWHMLLLGSSMCKSPALGWSSLYSQWPWLHLLLFFLIKLLLLSSMAAHSLCVLSECRWASSLTIILVAAWLTSKHKECVLLLLLASQSWARDARICVVRKREVGGGKCGMRKLYGLDLLHEFF